MPKLLVPTDGSEESLSAVRFAAEMAAARPGVELHLLNVQPALPSSVTTFIERGAVKGFHDEQGEKALAPARALLDAAKVAHATHLKVGQAPQCIAAAARDLGVEQIVMGTRGLGAFSSFVLGSVAQRVLHLVDVPVTFVK